MGITDDTDILTDDGWLNISHLTLDHNVATLNPLTKVLEFHKPLILFNYTNISPMYNIVNENVNIHMTLSHPLYASPDNTSWLLTNGSFLMNQTPQFFLTSNLINKMPIIPIYTFTGSNITLSMNKWLQFLGLYLRFGSVDNEQIKQISIDYVSVNSLSYIITNINKELNNGVQFKLISHKTVNGVPTTKIQLPDYAFTNLSEVVPSWCYRLASSQLNILQVNGLVPNSVLPDGKYSSKNKALIDSLQIIYLLANKPQIIQQTQDGSYYLVNQTQLTNSSQFVSNLVGYVYELSVPNFVFMARCHNKPFLL